MEISLILNGDAWKARMVQYYGESETRQAEPVQANSLITHGWLSYLHKLLFITLL